MAIPVLIPAHNEAAQLPMLFEALGKSSIDVDPIVIDNASSDNTARVASLLGARVLRQPEPGQLRALQMGLKELGEREFILITDADTIPCDSWAQTMSSHAGVSAEPTLISGPIDFIYPPNLQILRHARNVYRRARATQRVLRGRPPIVAGPNIGLSNISGEVLSGILQLPNYGHGNDQAIAGEFLRNGGEVKQIWDKRAKVTTAGDRYPDFASFVRYVFSRESAYFQDGSKFADLPAYPTKYNDDI